MEMVVFCFHLRSRRRPRRRSEKGKLDAHFTLGKFKSGELDLVVELQTSFHCGRIDKVEPSYHRYVVNTIVVNTIDEIHQSIIPRATRCIATESVTTNCFLLYVKKCRAPQSRGAPYGREGSLIYSMI